MNWDRWGMNRRPFRAAPTLDLFVPVPSHDVALASLRSAFDAGEGIALLDGAPGSGKSMLALRFLDSLGENALPLYIPSARFAKPTDLHQAILFDLGHDYRGFSDQELRLALLEQLHKALAQSKRAVLVLDEAQHLAPDLLEEVRLLDNWDARGTKAVFTILVAQCDLRERLMREDGALIAGRIRRRPRMDALSVAESRQFIHTQLEQCGAKPDAVVNDEAIDLLAQHGRGNPRLLNHLALGALELAAEAGLDVVDVEAMGEVLGREGIELAETAESERPAKSQAGRTGETGEGRESGATRPPKQKVRSRRAA